MLPAAHSGWPVQKRNKWPINSLPTHQEELLSFIPPSNFSQEKPTSIQSNTRWLLLPSFSSFSSCLLSSSEESILWPGASDSSAKVYSTFYKKTQSGGKCTMWVCWGKRKKNGQSQMLELAELQAQTCSATNALTSWPSGRNSFQLSPASCHSVPTFLGPWKNERPIQQPSLPQTPSSTNVTQQIFTEKPTGAH